MAASISDLRRRYRRALRAELACDAQFVRQPTVRQLEILQAANAVTNAALSALQSHPDYESGSVISVTA